MQSWWYLPKFKKGQKLRFISGIEFIITKVYKSEGLSGVGKNPYFYDLKINENMGFNKVPEPELEKFVEIPVEALPIDDENTEIEENLGMTINLATGDRYVNSIPCPKTEEKMPWNYEEEQEEQSLGTRHNAGKLEWSLVDFPSIEPLVKVLMFGAQKYAPNNWKRGLPYTKTIESLLRHTFKLLAGEETDDESGIEHTGHIMANVMFLEWMMKNRTDLDDRYKLQKNG